jgi:hypothetical protein
MVILDAGKTAAKGDEVHLKPPGLRADDFWDSLIYRRFGG